MNAKQLNRATLGRTRTASAANRFALAHARHAAQDAERSAQLDADPRVRQPDPDEDQRLCGASR